MRLLLDQDVYDVTARYLEGIGHDITRASTLGLSRASDEELLHTGSRLELILVTRDRDFGHLVFMRNAGSGVIYLRILPSNIDAVHTELARVLNRYTEYQLQNAFVVITERGHRYRAVRR